jgi:hypothetical protein
VDDKGGINRGLIELDIRRGGLIFLFFFVALKEDL